MKEPWGTGRTRLGAMNQQWTDRGSVTRSKSDRTLPSEHSKPPLRSGPLRVIDPRSGSSGSWEVSPQCYGVTVTVAAPRMSDDEAPTRIS